MTTKTLNQAEVLEYLRREMSGPDAKHRLPFLAVQLIKDNCANYDWVGIYNLEANGELVLGPFLGKPSPHTRIKVGAGICGAAAASGSTIIVDDVNSDNRYLACSIETRSEIVVPILKAGVVVGEIDIDSHTPAAFGEADKRFLEQVCEILSVAY